MSKTAEKLSQIFRLAPMAKKAETLEDFDALIRDLEAQSDDATAEVARLEQSRDALLFDGSADVEAFHLQLLKARETETTLRRWLAEARRRRDEAEAEKARADLEAAAQEVRDVHAVGLEAAWCDFHAANAGVIAAAERIAEHERAIAWNDELAKQNGRPDLVVNAPQIRASIAAELDTHEPPPPVERHASETEAAYFLRVQNQAAMLNARENAIVGQAKRAQEAIATVINDKSPHDQRVFEVEKQRFVGPDGKMITKLRNLNGHGPVRGFNGLGSLAARPKLSVD